HQGRQVLDNLVFVDSAHWKIAQFWKAMTNETGEVEIDTEAIPSFIGHKVGLRVDVENTHQGTKRNVIKSMFYVGGKASGEQDSYGRMLAGEPEPVIIREENVAF